MYHKPDNIQNVYAVSPEDDEPRTKRGSAIPHGYGQQQSSASRSGVIEIRLDRVLAPLRTYPEAIALTLLLLAAAGFFGWQTMGATSAAGQVATPTVLVQHPDTAQPQELNYGSEPMLAQPDFFQRTREALLEESGTFIEADLEAMELTYYEDGEVAASYPIEAKGRPGSWWETPAGLYAVQDKRERHRSSFGSVDLPWSLPFQGNFFIHGIPEYQNGAPVDESYSGGCIRLATEDAEALFAQVEVGTPVLVFASRTDSSNADFQYEPSVPEMNAPHYLIADIGNNTILASSDLQDPAPIASITKLMTALVAAEHINLDARVQVGEQTFVQSIVPRLSDRQSVSMYSLLQLLLIESSNEAANMIADQVGRETFLQHMNEKATAIGMEQTTFTDPSGLDNGNVSTLADLLRLVQYIHDNRSFILELTADQYVPTAYDADAFGELNNFNLLANLDNFYGGKTGETRAAGQTSVSLHSFTVRGEERKIAIAVLGSSDRTLDVLQLYSYFEERFAR